MKKWMKMRIFDMEIKEMQFVMLCNFFHRAIEFSCGTCFI